MAFARRAFASLLALGLAASSAGAGVIRGTVSLGAIVPASHGGMRGAIRGGAPATDAVVYLARIPEKVERRLARDAAPTRVRQAHGRFAPSPLPVAAGTTVTFTNADHVYHSVFSVSDARRFDAGKYAPGARRTVRFDRPGPVRLFCDIDPGEAGDLFVTPNHAFARPGRDGAFALPKLPRGTYELRVWRPGRAELVREVEVPGRGDVELDLRL